MYNGRLFGYTDRRERKLLSASLATFRLERESELYKTIFQRTSGRWLFLFNKAVEEYAIKFQDGLLKDGRNGLTVEEAIAQIAKRIWFYNSKVPCKENEQAIVALNDALYCLEQRTKDREKRGVEGTYEV